MYAIVTLRHSNWGCGILQCRNVKDHGMRHTWHDERMFREGELLRFEMEIKWKEMKDHCEEGSNNQDG